MTASAVVWHDVECGAYRADLPLWRELAAAADGPVLDVGAGTGRVALDLAARGHDVVALDAEPELLAALAQRATGLPRPVATVVADARAFALERRFALVLVPMQTVQLLGGAEGRAGFLRAAHRHLVPGGILAAALADALDGVDDEHTEPPLPDLREVDGAVFSSQVVAVREGGTQVTIERVRQTVTPSGELTAEGDVIALDRVDAATVEREARAAGFSVRPRRRVAPTQEHVGSEVVVLCRP
jgi:SAM-dependent methyltransferase